MEEQFISFKTAKLAKEKGFDETTGARYIDGALHTFTDPTANPVKWNSEPITFNKEKAYAAPTQSILQKWLREKHGLFVLSHFGMQHGGWQAAYCRIGWTRYQELSYLQDTFEEALEIALYEGLEMIDMTEKEIMYFISSHSHPIDTNKDRGMALVNTFQWPIMPDPAMGEDFLNKTKDKFKEIEKWIEKNPEKFKLAERGYYKKPKTN